MIMKMRARLWCTESAANGSFMILPYDLVTTWHYLLANGQRENDDVATESCRHVERGRINLVNHVALQ